MYFLPVRDIASGLIGLSARSDPPVRLCPPAELIIRRPEFERQASGEQNCLPFLFVGGVIGKDDPVMVGEGWIGVMSRVTCFRDRPVTFSR